MRSPIDVPSAAPTRITAVLGPTNTGKTHLAIERMAAHSSGLIGLPLRAQGGAFAPGLNALWLAVSGGTLGVVGDI